MKPTNALLFSLGTLAILLTYGCMEEKNPANIEESISEVPYNLDSVEKIIRYKTDLFTEAHITRDTSFLNNCFTNDARV